MDSLRLRPWQRPPRWIFSTEVAEGISPRGRQPSTNSGSFDISYHDAALLTIDIRGNLIVELADKHKLPTVYPFRYLVAAGGLTSLGPNLIEQSRLAAGYVDRILRGEKPAELPVQAPTKYDMVINFKTARALGLDVAPALLARADEVIE